MPDPIYTHWSGPPQHAGYWRGGTDWPERGGRGPMPGPHIPGLDPEWRGERFRFPQGPARVPRTPFGEERGRPQRQPRRPRGFNRSRPVRSRSR